VQGHQADSVTRVPAWSAEVTVDGALVRRLVGGQFPELELDSLELVGEGWDNTVWLVDERWIFRFPRRELAVPAVERQLAVLPRLAPRLPLPITAPAFAGRPAAGYPWPFLGAPYLAGREIGDADLPDDARVALAEPLGRFLRALHGTDAHAVGAHELPVDPMGRADMPFRVERAREVLAEAEHLGLWQPTTAVDALLRDAVELPPPTRLAVAHGDLHFRHLLVDDAGDAAGIVDWDDLCLADPAIDLQLLWSVLPPAARRPFLDAYGPVDEGGLTRARVLAIFLSATLAVYGAHEGLHGVRREAVAGLARAAAE
jgi:aminoglycoside phosphotransferase (APT) family kinase protein